MNIVGEKVYLRAMERSDMELYRRNVNDPKIEYAVGGWSFPISSYQQEKWYESTVVDKNNLRLTIVRKDTDDVIGMINLVNIDWKSGVAFSGIRLFCDEYHGKGYAKDAVMALMSYAFDELRLHRIEGSIIESNESSQKLYEKCGWKVEGVKREAIFKNGRYYDEVQVAILKSDYDKLKEKKQ